MTKEQLDKVRSYVVDCASDARDHRILSEVFDLAERGRATPLNDSREFMLELNVLRELAQRYEDLYSNALLVLMALLDRDITYVDATAVLPFESHDQAMNHIAEARRLANVKRAGVSASRDPG